MVNGADKAGRAPTKPAKAEAHFLDAAERHFAENGFAGTKIRAVAEEARANLGTLHYYWGSKEALLRDVCLRNLKPVQEERIGKLDEAIVAANGDPLAIETILEAYFLPAYLKDRDDRERRRLFCQILQRILTDPSAEIARIMDEMFDEASFRFVRMLRQSCSHLDDETFYWRLHGVLGSFQYITGHSDRIARLSQGRFAADDIDFGAARVIEFVAAGLRAPMTGNANQAPQRRAG
jgi:AcrR family transcriptional regulator